MTKFDLFQLVILLVGHWSHLVPSISHSLDSIVEDKECMETYKDGAPFNLYREAAYLFYQSVISPTFQHLIQISSSKLKCLYIFLPLARNEIQIQF